ncbi:mCG147312 [Mus musculus]|nr:mCG147312 [Mus musculus]
MSEEVALQQGRRSRRGPTASPERNTISRNEKGWSVRPGADAGPPCGRLSPSLTLLPTGSKHWKCLI